jgi:hypothetical protein
MKLLVKLFWSQLLAKIGRGLLKVERWGCESMP